MANTVEQTKTVAPRTQKVGRVVSDKMNKTVVVAVDYVTRHPLYHKRITRTSRFMAHDEKNECKPGDIVRIEETRPISKLKTWAVLGRIDTHATPTKAAPKKGKAKAAEAGAEAPAEGAEA